MSHKKHRYSVAERQQQAEEREERIATALRTGTQALEQKAVNHKDSFDKIARELREYYPDQCIRSISTFNRSIKSKNTGKTRLAIATHLFGKYKVMPHIQECWFYERADTTNSWTLNNQRANLSGEDILLQRNWFITAAGGGSIYKEHAKGLMTKSEVHLFLNCPLPCNFKEAILYAMAKQWTDNIGIISKVMKSKLNTFAGVEWLAKRPLWKEVIHFYCTNDITFNQMNDLVDYFIHSENSALIEGRVYSLKGRTLASLLRQMQDWHYELARVKKMGNSTWAGVDVPDDSFKLDERDKTEWSFTQIKTSKALAAEGTAMHHCVYSYQAKCVSGMCSIWSVTFKDEKRDYVGKRALTLEIAKSGAIVQIRGFANRAANAIERQAVRAWARKHNFHMPLY